jgi:hypothetical protein
MVENRMAQQAIVLAAGLKHPPCDIARDNILTSYHTSETGKISSPALAGEEGAQPARAGKVRGSAAHDSSLWRAVTRQGRCSFLKKR